MANRNIDVKKIDAYRNVIEDSINEASVLSLQSLYDIYAEGDACAVKAEEIACEVLMDMEGDDWHDTAVSMLAGVLLFAARCGVIYSVHSSDLHGWEYFCQRTRSVDGIREALDKLSLNHDPADDSICRHIEAAAEDIVAKSLFEAAKDGVQFLLFIYGKRDDPEFARIIPLDEKVGEFYDSTLANCSMYEKAGMQGLLLNEIGALRGIAYCMELVTELYETEKFQHFMDIQDKCLAEERSAVWAPRAHKE